MKNALLRKLLNRVLAACDHPPPAVIARFSRLPGTLKDANGTAQSATIPSKHGKALPAFQGASLIAKERSRVRPAQNRETTHNGPDGDRHALKMKMP